MSTNVSEEKITLKECEEAIGELTELRPRLTFELIYQLEEELIPSQGCSSFLGPAEQSFPK